MTQQLPPGRVPWTAASMEDKCRTTHKGSVCNSEGLEVSYVSVVGRRHKQNAAEPRSGILRSTENRYAGTTCISVGNPANTRLIKKTPRHVQNMYHLCKV